MGCAAWEMSAQPPSELANCLRDILKVLKTDSAMVDSSTLIFPKSDLTAEQVEKHRNYLLKGEFLRDLADLLQMTEWAEQIGAQRVRLYFG
jgi:hypothetical protein